ncbi:hypothetical protein M0R88_06430 [Halorussus gelatinilyticus]|uniref:Uncharacterized protein n=1 Tax=Halorussus gelatinilyticus TaxID=2937524 RepID=A0A8U0INJ0_9EURY|nr:hypothetical protein [Halorussus gelatinilyticus]UPW01734.1 hypothetical protein M0R88_06430 [Halorussus gelatinilyticus]
MQPPDMAASAPTPAALLAAALLVVAGCTAPTSVTEDRRSVADRATTAPPATAGERPTTSAPSATTAANATAGGDNRTIEARGAPLPVNQTRIFARVQRVLGTNVTRPEYVYVVEDRFGNATTDNDTATDDADRSPGLYRFWRLAGVESEPTLDRSERRRIPNGATTLFGGIRLYPSANYTASSIEWVLAHEYVHYIQFKNRRSAQLRRTLSGGTTDDRFVIRSVLEGAAVYATDAYLRRYVPGDRLNSEFYTEYARQLAPGSRQRYANLRYIAGHRYVAGRIDSPARLAAVYDRPPRTSEQVLHGYPPGAEPARPMPVSVNLTGSAWRRAGTDTLGEAFVRVALRTGLNESRAACGAAGWGNDTLYTFRRASGNASYAWVLRWDDSENASEFASAFAASLDARAPATNGTWTVDGATMDVRSPGGAWTVVLAGPEGFVRGTDLTVEDGNLSVGVAER